MGEGNTLAPSRSVVGAHEKGPKRRVFVESHRTQKMGAIREKSNDGGDGAKMFPLLVGLFN